MPTIDFNDAIRQTVSEEVERALRPHVELLRRLATVFGGTGAAAVVAGVAGAPVRRGPGRPPKAGGPAARRRGPGRPRKAGGAGKGDASKFSEGQAVRYKQGRGEFAATVTKIDTATNMLTLRREKDGKTVDRPAAKVY